MRLGKDNDVILKSSKIKLQDNFSMSRGLGNEREPVKGDLER